MNNDEYKNNNVTQFYSEYVPMLYIVTRRRQLWEEINIFNGKYLKTRYLFYE